MIPIVTTVSGLILRPILGAEGKDGRKALAKAINDRLNQDHPALARDERHLVHVERSRAGESAPFRAGETVPEGAAMPVAWKEYVFPDAVEIGECRWQAVRWRFYRNGRIAFQAAMSNVGGGLDGGDMQGHRIELRSADGHLLGAWTAGFFVRSKTAVREYPASILDEHPLLALHFDELAERQSGHWFFER